MDNNTHLSSQCACSLCRFSGAAGVRGSCGVSVSLQEKIRFKVQIIFMAIFSGLKPPVLENPVQDSPNLNRVSQTADNDNHLYDEIVTEYSLVGLARDADSTVIYSTVQHCDPAPQNDENDLYSLIMQY
ncbi:hypothetical protein cypCar_00002143 [Cyprinus carpio]|nr:hypothetical protein cypCar_00002143 [Cyprinus carpio]